MTSTPTPPEETAGGPAAGVRWDLSHLYAGPDDPKFAADLDAAEAEAERLAERYRGRIAQLDADALAGALDELEALQEPVGRAGAFASLLFAGDTANPRHGALLQDLQERATEIHKRLLFFELEWLAADGAHVAALLQSPALAKRRHFLTSMRRYRDYVLSEEVESVLSEAQITGGSAWGRLFDEVMASMRFQVELGGETRDLSEEETLSLLYDAERDTRRAAAEGLTRGLRSNARVLGFIFNTLVQDKALDDRRRGYPQAMAARNLANEAQRESVDALIEACVGRYALVARYYRLKARLLGLPKLVDYDRYAPLPGAEGERSFESARQIVVEAYRDFSPKMAEVALRFFDERWIDAELRPAKRGGAFSASTVPSVHPYVLLNYTGNLRDVMTLAHELGHGVHQTLAAKQGLFEQDTPLTTAETASVFGEMLVFRRLMREESDPKVRLSLLCGKLEDAFATVFRQVAMTRFEQTLHEARREEGELSLERIDALWMEANRPMFGDSVELSDDYACWWLYIPHFVHSPFYCYAYAFGELLVLALLRRYDEEGEGFVEKYLGLLEAGGSDTPENLLAKIGLDIADPAFWQGGLVLLEELLAQAEALAEECGAA